ncbi:MAG: hypothetical protein RLZZ621_1070 [Gemmatimonadota bacterium]
MIADRRAGDAMRLAQAEAHVKAHVPAGMDAPIILIPSNPSPMVPQPVEMRAAFLEHITQLVRSVWALPLAEDAENDAATRAAQMDASADSRAEDAACGTCRGACCPSGGSTAFLDTERMVVIRRVLASQGDTPTADQMISRYKGWVPDLHAEGSCVMHGPDGCTVPRVARASLCNRYRCGGLTQLVRALEVSPAAYAAAGDGARLDRVARITDVGRAPVGGALSGLTPFAGVPVVPAPDDAGSR